MTDNLKRAGFLESPITFFMVSVLDFYISNTRSFSLMSSKTQTTRRIKSSQHVFCLQTVLKLTR